MKHLIASALCAAGLMAAAAPASAGIIKIITKQGEVVYYDTSTGQKQGSMATAASNARGTEAGANTVRRSSGADSTIGFHVPPPAATGGGSAKAYVHVCLDLHASDRCFYREYTGMPSHFYGDVVTGPYTAAEVESRRAAALEAAREAARSN